MHTLKLPKKMKKCEKNPLCFIARFSFATYQRKRFADREAGPIMVTLAPPYALRIGVKKYKIYALQH